MKLAVSIGVPSGSTWESRFGLSLAKMMVHYSITPFVDENDKPMETELHLLNANGSILPELRNDIAKQAMENGSTHLLWVDSDMDFPPDTLNRLIAHGLPVVGANCVRKSRPSEPTASRTDMMKMFTRKASTGLEQSAFTGTGVLLIQTHVLMAMHRQYGDPLYAFAWHQEQGKFMGEDVRFCVNWTKMGGEVWVDHDLSKQVHHIGRWSYGHDDVPGWHDKPQVPHVADPVAQAAE
jgi:hypothetical protein